MKQHKHAELIKAWADGSIIQYYYCDTNDWKDVIGNKPLWDDEVIYRVKPDTVLPKTTLTGDGLMTLARGVYDEMCWEGTIWNIANDVIAEFIRSGEMDKYIALRNTSENT